MKDKLIRTASVLNTPPAAASEEFSKKHEHLSLIGNQLMAKRPDLDRLVGEGNQQMAEDNNRNFARFMSSLFSEFDPNVLVETVLWVFRAYRSHGFQTAYWAANLDLWMEILRKELSKETFESICPFFNWLIVNIPIFVRLTNEAHAENLKADAPEH
jgi:hypothetical protein